MEQDTIFVCSKEAIVCFSYGVKPDDRKVADLARLVVIIGGMTSVQEPFEVANDGKTLTCKPFLLHSQLFYVAVQQRQPEPAHLTAHMVGHAIISMFHSSMTQVLEHVQQVTSAAIHNSTFSDSMGGELITIDDALSTLFDEDGIRDNYLAFEEHFLRGVTATSESMFANIISTLQDGVVYMFETSHSSESMSLFPLHIAGSSGSGAVKSDLDPHRRSIVLDYMKDPITVYNAPCDGTLRETSVVLFPGGSGMAVCAITESLVLVAITANTTGWSGHSSGAVVKDLSIDALPEPLRAVWVLCCARVRRAFPSVAQLEAQGSTMNQINYMLD